MTTLLSGSLAALSLISPRGTLAAAAPAPVLVKDINTASTPYFSGPKGAVFAAGNRAFFTAETEETGTELWTSDGTVKGTRLVKDIHPGAESSYIEKIVPEGNRVFFTAFNAAHGRELWISDGTDAGTRMVADLIQGPEGQYFENVQPFRKGVLFISQSDARPLGLWWTDGTEAGTRFIKEFPAESLPGDTSWFIAGNEVYLFLWETPDRQILWRTDGTLEGTRAIEVPIDSNTHPGRILGAIGTTLYFWSQPSGSPAELWKVDGRTALASKIGDLPDFSDTPSHSFVAVGTRGHFVGYDALGNTALWSIDGTPTGTKKMDLGLMSLYGEYPIQLLGQQAICYDDGGAIAINLKTGKKTAFFSSSEEVGGLEQILIAGSKMYLLLNTPHGHHRILTSNGTAAGTQTLMDMIVPGIYPWACAAGSQIFFPAFVNPIDSPFNGLVLWKSNGTPAGTIPLQGSLNASHQSEPSEMTTVASGVTYFSADDGIHGREIWRTDGTTAGTVMVKDINAMNAQGSLPYGFFEWNGHVYFSASHPTLGYKLWRTDGTEAGTQMVSDAPSTPYAFAVLGQHLYFYSHETVSSETRLWRTDGTAEGTVPLIVLPYFHGGPSKLVKHNDRLYFTYPQTADSTALYSTDGTPVSGPATGASASHLTEMTDLCLGPTPGSPETQSLYFRAMNTTLYRRAIFRVNPDGNSFTQISPDDLDAETLHVQGGTLVYAARSGPPSQLVQVFVSDGSLEGSQPVTDNLIQFTPFTDVSDAGDLFYYGQMRTVNDTNQYDLCCLNVRTKTATVLIEGFIIDPRYAQTIGDTFFFGGGTETVGGLWQTQGTPESTRSLVSQGDIQSWEALAPHKRQLLISGKFDSRGQELFSLDLAGQLEVSRLPDLAEEPRVPLATNAVIDFGSAAQGSVRTLRLRLDNPGLLPLQDVSVAVLNGPFLVQTPAPAVLRPGGQTVIEINFAPLQTGAVLGQLQISGKLAPDDTTVSQLFNLRGTALKAASAPVIGGLSGPQIIRVGESAHFAAQVFSAQPITAHAWKRGSTKVGTDALLNLTSAQATDAGAYTYSATNASGTATSPAATAALLAVLPPLPEQVTAIEDGVLTLTCTATVPKGGKLSYQWYQNGRSLTDRDTFKGTRTAKLTVAKAGSYDTGLYFCRVTLTAGGVSVTRDTTTAEVTLLPKPTFTEPAVGSFVGQDVSVQIEALDGVSFSAKSLPPGLKISSSGLVTGRATQAGTFTTVLSAKNAAGTRNLTVPWTIHPALPAGVYDGLISLDSGRATETQLGSRLMMTATGLGTVSGRLIHEGKIFGFAATPVFKNLDDSTTPATVRSEFVIRQGGTLPDLTVIFDSAPHGIFVGLWDKTTLVGDGTVYATRFYATGTPAPQTLIGNYTWRLTKTTPEVVAPEGHGFSTASITADGMVYFQGRLADGSAILGSSPILRSLAEPDRLFFTFRHYLYPVGSTVTGTFGGEVALLPQLDDTYLVEGTLDWKKAALPATSKERNHKDGIPLHEVTLTGSSYTLPDTGKLVWNLTPATGQIRFTVSPTGWETAPEGSFVIATGNKVTLPPVTVDQPLKALTFDVKKGTFKGTLLFLGDTAKLNRTVTFEGILDSARRRASGHFLLPDLPSAGPPATTLTTSPLRSGAIEMETQQAQP